LNPTTQKRKPRPLWTCPKCRHRFVTRNLSHSCVNVPLADHFVGKDPGVRRTFNAWRQLAKDCGPVTIYAQKSRIVFMVRVRFAGAMTHRTWLEGTLWLKRRVSHPRMHRLMDYGNLGFGLHLKLTSPDDIDSSLAKLMREAYRIGRQQPAEANDT
jgi:hypothetical protein